MPGSDDRLLPLAAQIVSAYVEHNDLTPRNLPGLIRDVYRVLAVIESRASARTDQPAARAVPGRKAAAGQGGSDDRLVCMECGLHMKMLKRHLQTVHNVTAEQYRAKWNLPADYPLVSRQYAALRSSLARENGLGKRSMPRGRQSMVGSG